MKEDLQLVIFAVGEDEFAIHISLVREIINISKLVALPNMPAAMVGIIDVRGAVLPVVDLRRRFAMGDTEKHDITAQKVLLVEMGESMIGYLVDNVLEVLQVPRDVLEESSKINGLESALINAICNLDERLIPVVDATKLLSDGEVGEFKGIAREGAVCSKI